MFKFESCWKCEEMNNVSVLNSKLPIDICNRVCEYDKCDKCRKKIIEMEDFDENPRFSKLNKVQKIIIHILYRNHDIDTIMDRRKYKNIIKRSNNPLRKIMKHFVNIRNHSDRERFMFHGVCHASLLYSVISRLSDPKVLKEIAYYKIKTATMRFNGFEISKEVIVKEIIRECFDFWLVGRRDYYNTTTEEIMEYVEYVFSL